MKKGIQSLVKIILLISVIFVSSSCEEGPMGPMGPRGYDGEGTKWKVMSFTVRHSDWKWDSELECYYYDFNISELTQSVVNEGIVDAVVLLDGRYVKLQNTEYFYTVYNDAGDGMYISESLNFEYRIGYIRFTVKALDLYDTTPETYLPNTYEYKVTLIW